MKSNYIVVLVLVLLVAVGAILFFSAPEAEAPHETENTEEVSLLEEQSQEETAQEQQKELVGSNEGGAEEVPVVSTPSPTQEVAGARNPGPDQSLYTVVTYTEDGFSPRVQVIQPGEVVFFWNQSDDLMWVSGDLLSCDTSERGTTFDSCGEIGVGNGWTYTFTEPGTFDYKDNNDWNNAGRIIVE